MAAEPVGDDEPHATAPDPTPTTPESEDPLLAAKFAVPSSPRISLDRASLVSRIDAAHAARVIAVTAPAGYGKTTLVAQWVRTGRAPGPVVWLNLDEYDNTPDTFWAYLCHALLACTKAANPLPTPGAFDAGDGSALLRLATSLAAAPSPLTLILDHAEVITSRTIATQLDVLLRYAAPGLRLVVVGRSAQLLPLYRYRLAGDLMELQTEDLALTCAETGSLVAAHGVHQTDADTAMLHTVTEGWLTAVCLHALALRSGKPRPGALQLAGHRAVGELLRSDVFGGQSPRVRGVLLRASIVEQVDGDLAARLSGRHDARVILDNLVRSNAFVQAVDNHSFRFLAPLRGMLRDELMARYPSLIGPLHMKAATWYGEQGRYAESLQHATRAGAWGHAADVAFTEVGAARLLTSPAAAPYRATLAALPDGEQAPSAQVLRSVLALAAGDVAGARAAAESVPDVGALPGQPLLALRATQVVLARYAGDAETAAAMAAEVDALRRQLPPAPAAADAEMRAMLLCNTGVAMLWSGRTAEARSLLLRTAATIDVGVAVMVHDAMAHLALLALRDGTLDEAEACARQALSAADRAQIPAAERAGAASIALAAVALERNDLVSMREHLVQAERSQRGRRDPPATLAAPLLRAWAAIGRCDVRWAREAVREAHDGLAGWHPSAAAANVVTHAAGAVHLIDGDAAAARRCLADMDDGPDRSMLIAGVFAAEGDAASAQGILTVIGRDGAPPRLLHRAALALGRLAHSAGDLTGAARALQYALDHGRTERRRMPFIEAAGWVRAVLRQRPDVLTGHDWLALPDDAGHPGLSPVVEPLTDRETEVLGRLAAGLSSGDIADDLFLSVNTVKTHLKSIYRKLGASSRSAAARRARELRLVPQHEPERQ